MSEEENYSEAPSEETTTTQTVVKPKKAAKKPPKKADKPVKKAAKKVAKKAVAPPRDNARKVAKASEGKLNTDQVRILRALRKGKALVMQDIKTGVGMAAEAKYSGTFLKAIHNLRETRRVKVEEGQDHRAHTFTITERGKSDLEKAESAAK